MAFRFNWKFFDVDELQNKSKHVLTESISKTKRPPVMVTPLQVVNIEFGTKPPELAFHSIDYVGIERAHIVFKLSYSGDASLSLATNIEANPLREPYFHDFPDFVRPKVVGATSSLVLPFTLKLHSIELDTFVDVIYTPRGLVINFRGEPVKHIEADSSLDMIPGVKEMIAALMKPQLSEAFYEDIPETLWTMSSPHRTPPDPSRGPRRWSQQHVNHVRFTSLGPVVGLPLVREKRPYDTLALDVKTVNHAITSRARLPESRRSREGLDRGDRDDLPALDGIADLFEEASVSSRTSMASSAARSKPRRRVISVRNLIPNTQPPSGTQTDPPTPQNVHTPQMHATRPEDESAIYDLSPLGPGFASTSTSSLRRPSMSPVHNRAPMPKLRTSSLQESKPRLPQSRHFSTSVT